MDVGTIKLYTGATCSACTTLKNRLAHLNLDKAYTECDTAQQEHKDAIVALGHRSIPVLVRYVNGKAVDSINGSVHTDSELWDFFTFKYTMELKHA